MQFNGLTIQSIATLHIPTQIMATVQPSTTCKVFPTKFSTLGAPTQCPSFQTVILDISADTKFILRNRTRGILANFAPGDTINVFGFFNGTPVMKTDIIRNISKPTPGVATIMQMIQRLQTTIAQIRHQIGLS
jgi:hypothetical protein